jgi:hypothetical protein
MKTKIANNVIIKYNNKSISSTFCTNVLGITLDGALSWKNHIDVISKKLSRACFIIRTMKQHISITVLKAI